MVEGVGAADRAGVTVLGWMTLPRNEPAPVNGTPRHRRRCQRELPRVRAERIDRPRRVSTGMRTLPGSQRSRCFRPRHTYSTFLSPPTMLHERHFRAMNTDVGVWVWSTAAVRAPMIGLALEWAEGSLHASRTSSAGSEATPRSVASTGGGWRAAGGVTAALDGLAVGAAGGGGQRRHLRSDPAPHTRADGLRPKLRSDAATVDGTETIAGQSGRSAPGDACGSTARPSRSRYPPMLALDFGGIAKGWTVDHVALALAPLGPVLVDAGGDLRVIGAVGGEAWPIAVQDAFDAGTRPRRRAPGRGRAGDQQHRRTPVAPRRPACCTTSSTREPARRRTATSIP